MKHEKYKYIEKITRKEFSYAMVISYGPAPPILNRFQAFECTFYIITSKSGLRPTVQPRMFLNHSYSNNSLEAYFAIICVECFKFSSSELSENFVCCQLACFEFIF